ncbi:competence protein ComGG [Streptococcus parasuis]|uniref:competence type IV pilus minor pilin ComGG n=1 Tax=Streptococcus parasuis TaxID=1501662 RepID=UPI001C2BED85|nr:competence type IV pilus minor pilin ComGG [Streptococcus parasuis]MBV1944186.1 competence protein ComGG [Streptococcus parasuis]QXF05365.1 competence protein ComGG [Streptococcus parasuis]
MFLKKRIKAGVLLYALLMLAVFSLILQFYLNRQFVESQLVQVTKQEATAYMMAQMVSEQVKIEYQQEIQLKKVSQDQEIAQQTRLEEGSSKTDSSNLGEKQADVEEATKGSPTQKSSKKSVVKKGQISFQQGQSDYSIKNNQLSVVVTLNGGKQFIYHFPISSQIP